MCPIDLFITSDIKFSEIWIRFLMQETLVGLSARVDEIVPVIAVAKNSNIVYTFTITMTM